MGRFNAGQGNIHFLFADEDDYYTESLVKLTRKQYLNYCLRRDGYCGIFFAEYTDDGGYLAEMGNRCAAETYPYEDPDGNRLKGRKDVQKEQKSVWKNDKLRGIRFYARHGQAEELYKRIHYLIRGREKHAFVMTLDTFCRLYKEKAAQEKLREDFAKGAGSVLVLTASMNANDSFFLLTDCAEAFPEVRKIMAQGGRTRFYEELSNELGENYHVFNQMKREEIRRFLLYLQMVEGKWEETGESRLEDYTDLLYAWYHFMDFGVDGKLQLPDKGKRSFAELADCLGKKQSRIWQQMDACIERIRKEHGERGRLRDAIPASACEEREWHPAFAETADVRRIRRAVRGIAGVNSIQLAVKLHQAERFLTFPWSDHGKEDRGGLHRMLRLLERLQQSGVHSQEIAVRVLDYLHYSTGERYDTEETFQIKSECSERLIECLCAKAELEHTIEQPENRLEEYHAQYGKLREKLKEMAREPLYQEMLRRIKDGELEITYLAIHAPDIYQVRMEMVRVNDAIKTTGRFISSRRQKINELAQSAVNLENMLAEMNQRGGNNYAEYRN